MARYFIMEACERIGVRKEFLVRCIRAQWVRPAPLAAGDDESESSTFPMFDDEDIARARLIRELMEDFGANEESIPIILHLLDQLYELRRRSRTCKTAA